MKLSQLILLTAVSATLAHATQIVVPDLTQTPTSDATAQTDIATPNGGPVTPNTNGSLSYVVTTFTWGAGSEAHIQSRFNFTGGQNRLGVVIQDTGAADFAGSGDPGRTTTSVNGGGGAGFMAGETVTMIWRSYFHSSNDGLRATLGTSDDMLMNIWINPTGSSTENTPVGGFGSGDVATTDMLNDGDMHTLWNSHSYGFITNTIFNQTTTAGAGDSSIINTTILTGADATFSNALALATVPETSAALLIGLAGLALIARRRR